MFTPVRRRVRACRGVSEVMCEGVAYEPARPRWPLLPLREVSRGRYATKQRAFFALAIETTQPQRRSASAGAKK